MALLSVIMGCVSRPIKAIVWLICRSTKKHEDLDKGMAKSNASNDDAIKPLKKMNNPFKQKQVVSHEPVITTLNDDEIKQKMVSELSEHPDR